MRKAYLLIFDPLVGSQEQVRDAINAMPEVVNWRFDMPFTIYFISEEPARNLSLIFRQKMHRGRFLILEVTNNKQGYMLKETWDFLNSKRAIR